MAAKAVSQHSESDSPVSLPPTPVAEIHELALPGTVVLPWDLAAWPIKMLTEDGWDGAEA